MRVLVADQEPDMLEQIARAFEVDVATSKATCVDLLRANDFDVLVACERLSDGSGLELLSHVGQRWPNVIRILAIEPERRALLKGKLGPFKLFETISYPITDDKLEAALTRASEALSRDFADEPPARSAPIAQPLPAPQGSPRAGAQTSPRAAQTSRSPTPATTTPSARGASTPPAHGSTQGARPSAAPAYNPTQRGGAAAASRAATPSPSARGAGAPNAATPNIGSRSGGQSFAQVSRPRSAADDPAYPPLPRKGSKIVPLGSPETQFRILPHDYHEQHMPGTLPKRDEPAQKAPTLQEKAAALASGAMKGVSELVRQIKPPAAPPPPPKAPPGKKR